MPTAERGPAAESDDVVRDSAVPIGGVADSKCLAVSGAPELQGRPGGVKPYSLKDPVQ